MFSVRQCENTPTSTRLVVRRQTKRYERDMEEAMKGKAAAGQLRRMTSFVPPSVRRPLFPSFSISYVCAADDAATRTITACFTPRTLYGSRCSCPSLQLIFSSKTASVSPPRWSEPSLTSGEVRSLRGRHVRYGDVGILVETFARTSRRGWNAHQVSVRLSSYTAYKQYLDAPWNVDYRIQRVNSARFTCVSKRTRLAQESPVAPSTSIPIGRALLFAV